ncbi:hypothetical protein [Legionella lansingensis]|nr:hypothetical protein [Legionella lansingensis]
MNETQKHLLNEQYEDRIGPCIKEIVTLAKSDTSRRGCIYLILKAVGGSLNPKQYSDLLTEYLGDSKKQLWLRERLISLNNLFQPNNSEHLFIKHIIDKRFYCDKDISLDDWTVSCIHYITAEYTRRIHAELQTLAPSVYEDVMSLINSENEDKMEPDEFSPGNSFYSRSH